MNLRDKRKVHLMTGVTKFQKGEEMQKYISYYLTLIESRDESRDAALTLKGYVNHHSEFCPQEDCPLKSYKKQQQKDQKKQYGQFGQTHTLYSNMQAKNQVISLESHPLLISQAKNLYMSGIKKFPFFNGLKIDFSYFLLNKMHNKKDALKELMNAEKQKPSFSQQFKIFRYQHIIEDELHEGSDSQGGGLDYVAALNFENHYKIFKQLIQKSAILHYEFWNHLMDDHPDLAKLSEQGSRINASIQHIEVQWKKLTQESTQTPKALRLYASYLIEILNDKELGNEQLMKAKEAAIARVNFDFNNINEDTTDMNSFAADGSPCIYISGEQDRLGIITQCNLSACRIFGYTKKEDLINHEVEILMPRIYAKQHKKFLEAAIQKPPDLLSQKERQVFGKHHSGYIFPVWFAVKNLPSFLSGRQFVATFKVEKSGINKNVAHLLLDKNKEVIDVSSSCLAMLELDLNLFQKRKAKLDIQLLLPSLYGQNNFQFINKAGGQIEYQYPQFVEVEKNEENSKDSRNNEDGDYTDQQNEEDDEEKSNISDSILLRTPVHNNSYMNQISMIEEEDDGLLIGNSGLHDENGLGGGPLQKRININNQIDEAPDEDEDDEDRDRNMDNIEIQNYDYKIVPSNKTANFQCYMIDIHFDTQNLTNPSPGQYIRLETLQDKQNHSAKIQKTLKQGAFQFSYDPLNKRFSRELRDRDNKEILLDKNYLQLKKFKESYLNQLKSGGQIFLPAKIMNMTYMNYLNKYQKWVEKGGTGSVLDDYKSESSSNNNSDIDEDDNTKETVTKKSQNNNSINTPIPHLQEQPQAQLDDTVFNELKKFIPGEGSGKDFLKQEIERMINVLRKKQEIGTGIHCFRRLEPNAKNNNQAQTAITNNGKFEEVQFSVASLFAGRSSDRVTDLDDDLDSTEESERSDKPSKNESLRNTIKSRKAFQMAINDKSVPAPIKRLNRIANFILLCLIAISVIDYSLVYKQLQETITNYQVIESSYKRIAEIQKVCYNVRSMIMINNKTLTNTYGYATQADFITFIKNDLTNSLNELYNIQNQINLAALSVSYEHAQLLYDKTVYLDFEQGSSTMQALQFSLTEAILQIQSSIFSISNMQLSDFVDSDQDIFFLMYNSFNELHLKMFLSANLYVTELTDRSNQNSEVELVILILSIVFLSVIVIVLIPVVTSVNRQKDKVLTLFCDIDDSSIRVLSLKCEKFMNKLDSDDHNNDMESNDEEMLDIQQKIDHEDLDYGLYQGAGKRSKRSKNNTKTNKFFYVKFIFAILIVEAYFAYDYGMIREFITQTQHQVNELNKTANIEPFFWFAQNAMRELFYNESTPINNMNSLQVTEQSIFEIYNLTEDLQETHLQDQSFLSAGYFDYFNQVMNENLCSSSVQTYFTNITQCQQQISGIADEGLYPILSIYVRTMRLQLAQSYIQNNNRTLLVQILNDQEMYNLYIMQYVFVQSYMRSLVSNLNSAIISGLNTTLQDRLFLLIFFLIIILLAYVSLWIPLVNSLNTQIYKTKLMLMIIPLEILMRMKNVGKVLQSQNFIQEKNSVFGNFGNSRSSSGKGDKH